MQRIILNFVCLNCLLITWTDAQFNSRKQVHDLIRKTMRRVKMKRETFNEAPHKYLPINTLFNNNNGRYFGSSSGLGQIIDYASGNLKQSGTNLINYNLLSKGHLPRTRYTSVFSNSLHNIGGNSMGVSGLKHSPTTMPVAYFNQDHQEGRKFLNTPGISYSIGNGNDVTSLSNNMPQDFSKYLSQSASVGSNGYTDNNVNIINSLTAKQPLQITDSGSKYAPGHNGLGHFSTAYKQFDSINPHLDGKLSSNSFNPATLINSGNLNGGNGILSHYMSPPLNNAIHDHGYDNTGALTYSPNYSQTSQYSVENYNNRIHELSPGTLYNNSAKPGGIIFKKTHFID